MDFERRLVSTVSQRLGHRIPETPKVPQILEPYAHILNPRLTDTNLKTLNNLKAPNINPDKPKHPKLGSKHPKKSRALILKVPKP